MKAQDLKNSILQLAIQGKLVEQRAEEGTAKELLEKIEAEKKQLIQEGKIKKTKVLPEITEEEIPFDIPKSWEWVRLGDALDIARGGSPRPIKSFITDSADGINWIKIGDTDKGGKYINRTNEKIIKEGMKKSRFVRKGDFLLSNSMSFGRPYILNIDGCIHDGWLVLSQIAEVFNKDYLYYLLSSTMVFNQFASIVSGAVVNNLNSDKVRLTLVPLPPLEEQKRILAKIEELMPYVDKYDVAYSEVVKLNKKFPEDMQKSILQYAIQGKLVAQRKEDGTAEALYQQIQAEKKKLIEEGRIKKTKALPEITEDEIPFDIPENWKWVRLGDIVSVKGGKRLPPGKKLTQEKTKHIYIRVTDMKNQTIDDKDLHYLSDEIHDKIRNYIIEKSDIYIVIVGSTIGKVGLVPEKFHGMNLTENAARLIPICVNKEYLMRYLTTQAAQTQFIDLTNQVGQPKLALIRLKNTLVPLAPIEEQKRIVEKIEEMLPYTKQLVK